MRLARSQLIAWRKAKAHLLVPIVYLRGFAMTGGEIEDTSADPFNGFNIGSTLLRTAWTGDTARHVFESPVLRLSQPPYSYRVAFSDGIRGLDIDQKGELQEWSQALAAEGAEAPRGICRQNRRSRCWRFTGTTMQRRARSAMAPDQEWKLMGGVWDA